MHYADDSHVHPLKSTQREIVLGGGGSVVCLAGRHTSSVSFMIFYRPATCANIRGDRHINTSVYIHTMIIDSGDVNNVNVRLPLYIIFCDTKSINLHNRHFTCYYLQISAV